MTEDFSTKIEQLLLEADECDMLGGLAATHEERVAHRKRAKELRSLAKQAQVLSEQSKSRSAAPQKSISG